MICRRWQQKEYSSCKTNASLMSSTLKHAAKRRAGREDGDGDGESWRDAGTVKKQHKDLPHCLLCHSVVLQWTAAL